MSKKRMQKIKSLLTIIEQKLFQIDTRVELLRPMLIDKNLIKKINDNKKSTGFDYIRLGLVELCLIQTLGLLKSTDLSDASFSSFIDDFKDTTNPIYQFFKKEFVEGSVESMEYPIGWEDIFKKGDRDKFEQRFDTTCDELIDQYSKLMAGGGLGNKINKLRNKVFAHFSTKLVGSRRFAVTTEDHDLRVNDIFKIMDELFSMYEKAVLVIKNTALTTDSTRKGHKDLAHEYWEIES